jgi:hypothetical protein
MAQPMARLTLMAQQTIARIPNKARLARMAQRLANPTCSVVVVVVVGGCWRLLLAVVVVGGCCCLP